MSGCSCVAGLSPARGRLAVAGTDPTAQPCGGRPVSSSTSSSTGVLRMADSSVGRPAVVTPSAGVLRSYETPNPNIRRKLWH